MRCPVATCGVENPSPVATCLRCGADLRAYAIALGFHDLWFNRALAHASAGEHAKAQHELGACLALHPGDEEAELLLAKSHWAAGDRQTARREWESLVSRASDPAIREAASACLNAVSAKKARKPAGRKRARKGKRGKRR